jgi:type VI secretion system protein ImpL
VDKGKLVAELKARYATDYVDHWRKFLKSAAVARYGGVGDAAQKLTVLSGNQSPLLALFSVASQNTAIPAPDIARVFQSVHTVTPPADTVKLIGTGNQPYMAALVTLQSSLEQASKAQGPGAEAAAGQAAGNAIAAKTAARQIASTFTIDQQGQTQGTVQKLMEDPITYAEALLTRFGADQVNAQGRAFCAVARSVMNKLPFNPDATVHATVPEVAALLRPGTGSLWTLYTSVLQASLQKQGTAYVAQGGNVRLSPGFVAFFNRAATLSDALFANGAQTPTLSFTLQPMLSEGTTGVVVTAEGDVVRATRNSLQSTRIDWPAPANHEAKLAVQLGSPTEITLVGPYSGTWALFQMFYGADSWQPTANGMRAEWTMRSRGQGMTLPNGAPLKIAVEVTPASAAAALRRGSFAGASCPGEIAQ